MLEATRELDAGPIWSWRELSAARRDEIEPLSSRDQRAPPSPACSRRSTPCAPASRRRRRRRSSRRCGRFVTRQERRIDFADRRRRDGATKNPHRPTVRRARRRKSPDARSLCFDAHRAPTVLPPANPGALAGALRQSDRRSPRATAPSGSATCARHSRQSLKLPSTVSFAAEAKVLLEADAAIPASPMRNRATSAICIFPFYNGAMGVADCRALEAAILDAAHERGRARSC